MPLRVRWVTGLHLDGGTLMASSLRPPGVLLIAWPLGEENPAALASGAPLLVSWQCIRVSAWKR